MPDRSRTWDGGWINPKTGTYIIRRRISGHLYEVSTRCTTSRAAHEQLRIFESDPPNYSPGTVRQGGDAVLLTAELAAQFLAWSRDTKHNTPTWVRDQQTALAWWIRNLGAVDLQRLPPADLVRCLDKAKTGRKQKIATLKTFFGWLRRERHAVTNDPTTAFSVPQARPEQWRKDKVIAVEAYRAVRPHLAQHYRDGLDILAGTGWHVSELLRFAESGRVEPHPMREGAEVLVCPRTKGGESLRTEVSDAVAQAGRRLLKHGALNYFRFRDALIAASSEAGVDEVKLGRFRHSVATWAINSGADPAQVAAFLGHKSPATTRRFYATHSVPGKVPTLA